MKLGLHPFTSHIFSEIYVKPSSPTVFLGYRDTNIYQSLAEIEHFLKFRLPVYKKMHIECNMSSDDILHFIHFELDKRAKCERETR